jgi:hypothetical protein
MEILKLSESHAKANLGTAPPLRLARKWIQGGNVRCPSLTALAGEVRE